MTITAKTIICLLMGVSIGVVTGMFGGGVLLSAVLACIVLGLLILVMEIYEKTITAQQTQIDDLKRELEAMKRKQTEPQS
jgi:uncharacterized membrane protein